MTLDRLRVFAAVAKHGSVSRAADELNITQPAVTKRLRVLQRTFKAMLYKRSGRGVELTDKGKIFLQDAIEILSQYDRLKGEFSGALVVGTNETLTVGGSCSPSIDLLPSLLALFRKSHPHVRMSLRTDNSGAIERMIINDEVDIAVINKVPTNHLLAIEPYRREPLVAFVLPNSTEARKTNFTWEDFATAQIVIRSPIRGQGAADQFLKALKQRGFTPNIAMRCDSPDAVKSAVKMKIGVGILFQEAIAYELNKGEFKLIKLPPGDICGESFIVYRKGRPLSKAIQDFLKLLREHRQKPAAPRRSAKLAATLPHR